MNRATAMAIFGCIVLSSVTALVLTILTIYRIVTKSVGRRGYFFAVGVILLNEVNAVFFFLLYLHEKNIIALLSAGIAGTNFLLQVSMIEDIAAGPNNDTYSLVKHHSNGAAVAVLYMFALSRIYRDPTWISFLISMLPVNFYYVLAIEMVLNTNLMIQN
jgi:hypothetical protein